MDTGTIRYEPRPLAITLIGVAALELVAMGGPAADPYAVTGVVRTLQLFFIMGVTVWFVKDASIAGLSFSGLRQGLKRGLLWSAAFGLAAAAAGAALALAGHDPVAMIGIRLPSGIQQIAVFFLVAAFIGPFAEEMFFRGVLYGFLRRFGIVAAIVGSSALFVAAHLSGGIALTHAVGALVFAATYEYEKNIWVPVVIHVLGNLALFSTALFP